MLCTREFEKTCGDNKCDLNKDPTKSDEEDPCAKWIIKEDPDKEVELTPEDIERACADRNPKPEPIKKTGQTKDQIKEPVKQLPEPEILVDPNTAIGYCSAVCVSNDCIEAENLKPLLTSFNKVPCTLPLKYEHPHWFNGYGSQVNAQHPFYRTSSGEYGWYPPGMHNIPTVYYGKPQKFSNFYNRTGMYRNYSLNTGLDSGNIQSGKMCS